MTLSKLLKSTALALGLMGLGLATIVPTTQASETLSAGVAAPDFSLRDIDGKEASLNEYRGKVVLINFWATWCQPCMVEMKHLDALNKKYADQDFVVLSISIDDARSGSMVKPIVKRNRYSFRVLLDKETKLVSQVNPAKTLPYNMLVDKEGKVVWTHLGYNPGDEEKMEEVIKLALAGAALPGAATSAPTPGIGE